MASIQSIGLQGVQRGMESAAEAAEQIPKAFEPTGSGDPVGPMIDLAQAKHQVEASAKVIKIGDALDKAVLDILA